MSTYKVIAGIDGSPAGRAAMFWAAAEAGRHGGELVLAHAGDLTAHGAPSEYGRSLLVEAEACLYEANWEGNLSTRIEEVDPIRLLTQLSRDADLVVVGAKGLSGTASALLGSTAFRVAAYAESPVATIPDGWTEPGAEAPVVVGASATRGAQIALDYAFRQAEARATSVLVVRAWSRIDWTGNLADLMYKTEPAFECGQYEYLDRLLEPVRSRYPHVAVQSVVTGGSVHDVLLSESEGSQLLVLGSRFSDGHHYSRLGPLTSRLLHTAKVPTVVVGHVNVPAGRDEATLRPARHAHT